MTMLVLDKGKLEQKHRCLWEKIVVLLKLGVKMNI